MGRKVISPILDTAGHYDPMNLISPFMSFSGGASRYKTAILADSPIAYFRLGEASGITAIDEIGNHNATYTPNSGGVWTGGTHGATGALAGDADTSALMNGTTGFVENGSSLGAALNGGTQASIEYWCYRSATNRSLDLGFSGMGVSIATDGNIYSSCRNGGLEYQQYAFSGTGWHYLCFVYNGSLSGNAKLQLYIDGSPVTLTYNGGAISATLTSSMGAFDIGNSAGASNGGFDEVAVYNTALSSARVAAHYAAGI